MPGEGLTHGPRATKKHAAEPQDQPVIRHSLRDGLRLIRDLPGVPGLLATVVHGIITRELSASVGAPGPHDFAVRAVSFVRMRTHTTPPRVHRIPIPRVVTIAIRPSCRDRIYLEKHNLR
jgi:hypothetical protein